VTSRRAGPRPDRRSSAAAPWALPALALAFGLYVVLHSPLRELVAALAGRASHVCYFTCDAAVLDPVVVLSVVGGGGLILIALAGGWSLADSLTGPSWERPLVFGLAALTLLVVPSASVGLVADWVHVPLLRPPLGPCLAMLPAALVVVLRLRRGWRPRWPRPDWRPATPLQWLLAVLGPGLLLASVAIGLYHPATGGDGLSYHAPQAVFFWQDGDLVAMLDRAPITFALANPGTTGLWYGLLHVVGGEPLANLGQLPFALLGVAAVIAFARRLGLGRGAARLAGLSFLLCPIVLLQATMQPNDLAGAALLMSAIALASAPALTWSWRRYGAVGLGLGLVSTTKLVLLPAVAGVVVMVIGSAIVGARRGRRGALALLGAATLGFVLPAAPWWTRNVVRYGNPLYPAGIPLLGGGIIVSDYGFVDKEFVPHRLAWPLYPLLEAQDDRSGFGTLFAVAAIPGIVLALRRARRRPLGVYGMSLGLLAPAWWLLTQHEPRFFLAHAGLGFAFLPWSLAALRQPYRRFGSQVVALAAIFSALVTIDQALLPFARQPTDRLRFYDRVWAVDPAAVGLPEREGLVYHTGYAPGMQEYAAYYPLIGPSQRRLVLPIDTEGTTELLVGRMQAAGVRFAYVAAAPDFYDVVERIYTPGRFTLRHVSVIERGEKSGARRYLYRALPDTTGREGFRRYLFELRGGATSLPAGARP
jgi:hypothetical protein